MQSHGGTGDRVKARLFVSLTAYGLLAYLFSCYNSCCNRKSNNLSRSEGECSEFEKSRTLSHDSISARHHPYPFPPPASPHSMDIFMFFSNFIQRKNNFKINMASKLTLQSTLPIGKTGLTIPRLGFGVYQSEGNTCIKSCLTALKAGCRMKPCALYPW